MKRFLCAGEGYGFFSKISTNLIIPLNFGCVLIVCLVSTLFLAHPSSAQQMQTEISRVTAGQKVPEAFWTTEFQFYDYINQYSQTLEQYKGKPILLGFWMVYCGPCIASFPKLNAFKDKYGEDLVILPVNSLARDSIPVIDHVLSKKGPEYRMPMIIQDVFLSSLFPHGPIPHYIWIQPDGKVGAITRRTFVTDSMISQFLGNGKN